MHARQISGEVINVSHEASGEVASIVHTCVKSSTLMNARQFLIKSSISVMK